MSAAPLLLITDLDGTLVRERDVEVRDALALHRWQKAGNLLVVATGRSVTLARLALEDASASLSQPLHADYLICASGTTVLDHAGTILRSDTIDPDEVERAVRYLTARNDCGVVATTVDGDYLLHNPFVGRDDSFNRFAAGFYTALPAEQARALAVTSMPVRIPNDEVIDIVARDLVARSGGKISAPRSIEYLDLVPAGADKGTAIRHMQQILAEAGVVVSRMIGVGDSWNDIPLFEAVDDAYAMETGTEDARRAARACGGCSVNNVAEVVARYLDEFPESQ